MAGRKHTALSRTELVNIHHHFLFHVSHCRLGRKHLSSSEEQAAGTAGLPWAFKKSPMHYKEEAGARLPLHRLFPVSQLPTGILSEARGQTKAPPAGMGGGGVY